MGSNPTALHINLFSFKLKHFQLEISSKCDIKAENSSTLYTFHEGRKGLRPMGSNDDALSQISALSINKPSSL